MPATSRCASMKLNSVCYCFTIDVNLSSLWRVCVHSLCVCLYVLDGAPSVWYTLTLCCGSGTFTTDLHSLLADCLGARDTHRHHANNSDREGTGIHTSAYSHTFKTGVKPSKQRELIATQEYQHYYNRVINGKLHYLTTRCLCLSLTTVITRCKGDGCTHKYLIVTVINNERRKCKM